MKDERLFILWDPKDGNVPRGEGGSVSTSGLIGQVGLDNVYLKSYASYPSDIRPEHLEFVGARISSVKYSLSGSVGFYDVVRVK